LYGSVRFLGITVSNSNL